MKVPTNHPHWPRLLTIALLAVAAILAVIWFTGRQERAVVEVPTLVTPAGEPPRTAANFKAIDHNGQQFELAGLQGKVTALFFGFTHCPDVCPLTLGYLNKAREALPPELRDDVEVVFVTLDPERDTPERLAQYVEFFGEGITGVHVPEPELRQLAQAYGVMYSQGEKQEGGGYEVYHSSSTLLIGPDGQPRMMYQQTPSVDRLEQDFREALSERGNA